MSLKTGDWKMNDNGSERTLRITSIDSSGTVSGGVLGGLPPPVVTSIAGIWDETSRTLTFECPWALGLALLDPPRFYKGFLFSTPRSPVPGEDIIWTLAGYFQVCDVKNAADNGGNVRRDTFGWFAQITEVG
jgi:hypothetical protein